MKKVIHILSVIISIAMLSGCAKDNQDEPARKEPLKREWYRLVKTDTLSCKKMSDEVLGLTLPLGSADMVRNTFLYHSTEGSDTLTISGVVCWPLGLERGTEIWLENHYLSARWDQCPSQIAQSGMLISYRRNAIYIAADYQGLGLSRELPHPYLNTILLAKQNIDCFKAAMTFLTDYGPDIADDYKTYNIGYSLGGGAALGVARIIELDPELRELTHLKKTFCGGAPYDQVAYLNHYLANTTKKLDYPIAVLCAIQSIVNSSPSFREKYDYADCFCDKFLNSGILEALDSKSYDSSEINSMLDKAGCKSIENILSAGILDKNSQISKDVFYEVSKLDLTSDWTPRIPILIRQTKNDTYIPFECMESVMKNWGHDNPNVTYQIVSSSHTEEGKNFYMSLFFGSYSLD